MTTTTTTTTIMPVASIVTSANESDLNYRDFSIPEAISTAGWTVQARGYPQQTFLGASITRFNMQGGYGDTSSTLSVELIVDEYNKSDETGLGLGDDVYHDGTKDKFRPPVTGSPVFFKFGYNFATVQEAFLKTYNDMFNYTTTTTSTTTAEPTTTTTTQNPSNPEVQNFTDLAYDQNYTFDSLSTEELWDTENRIIVNNTEAEEQTTFGTTHRGLNHLVFGGILQSYTQNRSTNGNPTYSVQITDPREILSNAYLILNNYTGTTYNTDNLFNIYGFLEYNASVTTLNELKDYYGEGNKSILKKVVDNATGKVSYVGDNGENKLDVFFKPDSDDDVDYSLPQSNINSLPPTFPITGTGFSRRGRQGIPYYRIKQALTAMFEYEGKLPDEYICQGFGGVINFRGFNYIVDFTDLPGIPDLYYFDFDQINLLDFAMEICDISSRDLFVSLVPVIDHNYTKFIHAKNTEIIANGEQGSLPRVVSNCSSSYELIVGIIRLQAIDRSKQPEYGKIKEFLDDLESQGIYVENRDVGYELSNIVTDKFIVGAQKTDMYLFNTSFDRNLARENANDQYDLRKIIDSQQILPYYGKLGKNAITIPKGFGSYQQILLDSTGLNVNGVGNYYVATELELRAAMISFDRWKEFLLEYNDKYLEALVEQDPITGKLVATRGGVASSPPEYLQNVPVHPDLEGVDDVYFVTVPRSVWPDDTGYGHGAFDPWDSSGKLPRNTCNPPYGWPLYYKRATQLGIPEAGFTTVSGKAVQILTKLTQINPSEINEQNYQTQLNNIWTSLLEIYGDPANVLDEDFARQLEELKSILNTGYDQVVRNFSLGLITSIRTKAAQTLNALPRIVKKATQNATEVHKFLQDIANECLGKKFLVKIPQRINVKYNKDIVKYFNISEDYSTITHPGQEGPFGFKALPKSSGVGDGFSRSYTDSFSAHVGQESRHLISNLRESPYRGGNGNERQGAITILLRDNNPLSNYAGALEGNFNPITEENEFNYSPTKLGGFFDFDLYSNMQGFTEDKLKHILYCQTSQDNPVTNPDEDNPDEDNPDENPIILPNAINLKLVPIDMTNLLNEQGRVSPYVRFDRSELLDLSLLNKDTYTQQIISNGGTMITDIREDLDNITQEDTSNITVGDCSKKFKQYTDTGEEAPRPTTVAFVKCDIDEQFYMPAKLVKRTVKVCGTEVKDEGKLVKPMKVWDKKNKIFKSIKPYREANFHPLVISEGEPESQIWDFTRKYSCELQGNIIDPIVSELDIENVYALITLPNRISPRKDARFTDSEFQLQKPESLKHYLTMDVVKIPDFYNQNAPYARSPFPITRGETDCQDNDEGNVGGQSTMTPNDAYKKAVENLAFALPQLIKFTSPSPVYPTVVAIPLTSKDRCYGPWISSQSDIKAEVYSNIGGKIEFIKDENLAPWNYGGYSLMNDIAKLQASFSNSLLLFSERGGFVVPAPPSGVNLGDELKSQGPLISNISVEIGTAGIHTTYQLDLYTASFGKLHKEKEQQIAQMSREKEKLRDEKNALLRKGLGKASKDIKYLEIQNAQNSSLDPLALGGKVITNIIGSVQSFKEKRTDSDGNVVTVKETSVAVSNTTNESVAATAENFGSSEQADRAVANSAGGDMASMFTPVSLEVYHPNMPSKHEPFTTAKQSLYPELVDIDTNNDLIFYEE
jgi:hypothetical protein